MPSSVLSHRVRFEVTSWTSLALVLALVEGGVIGVLIKNGFSDQVNDFYLNLAVALATGAPFFSNLLSFIWVKLSQGRNKARVVSDLAVICCVCGFSIGFIPFTEIGLLILLVALITARICWSGILTIRANIWRANYPRHIRGKVTAKMATLAAVFMSITAMATGWILDWNFAAFRWVYFILALVSLFGAFRYRRLTIRHHDRTLLQETQAGQSISFLRMFSLLKENPAFGQYMLAMFILGSGNLMFMSPLIVYLNEYTELTRSSQILITTAIPLALIPWVVGWWARLLDKHHIFHFRAIHSWGFVLAIGLFAIAELKSINALFFMGSVCYGIAISGGVIGWNLGHNDFVVNGVKSQVARPMEYMAVHVTLTGVRGLIAPLLGIGFYQWLEANSPGDGKFALLLPFSITLTGALLFVFFNRKRLQQAKAATT